MIEMNFFTSGLQYSGAKMKKRCQWVPDEPLYIRGFKFVGSTICYAFMQAVGLVNDHTVDCFRYKNMSKE